jgi:hypothetical protein
MQETEKKTSMIESAQTTLGGIKEDSQSSSAQTKLGGMKKNPKDRKTIEQKK